MSLTRSFHVPLAASEEAFTVYVVLMLSELPPVPYDLSVYAVPSGAISWSWGFSRNCFSPYQLVPERVSGVEKQMIKAIAKIDKFLDRP